MKCDEGVDHGTHGDEGEEASGDATNGIAEVEEADRQASEDDGEIEPGEKGALIGEEDFGLHAGGQGDSLPWLDGEKEHVSGAIAVRDMWEDGVVNEGKARTESLGMGSYQSSPGAVWRRGWLDMLGRMR
jgi:hypothetical protein